MTDVGLARAAVVHAHHERRATARVSRPVFALSGVTRHWGRGERRRAVLRDVNLELAPGSAICVTGTNGAGKTTLLRIAAGVLAPDQGSVRLDGLTPEGEWREYHRRIGFLSAGDRGLYARLSVRGHLEHWLALSLVPRSQRLERMIDTLERFDLLALAERRADRLAPATPHAARRASQQPRHRRSGASGGTGAYLDAAVATFKRDLTIFLSYRMRLVSQVATMLLTMTMFYYVSMLVRPGVVGPQGAYFAYVVVGIVALASLTAALNTAQLVRMELFSGTFERPIGSSLGPVGGAITLIVFPILYSLALSGLMLVVAAVVFDFPVQLAGIPAALGISALATIAFAAIGLILVALLIAFKSAMAASWVVAGFTILGGVYFPMTLSLVGCNG